jgi:uncharacterized delta-60 repeat protein
VTSTRRLAGIVIALVAVFAVALIRPLRAAAPADGALDPAFAGTGIVKLNLYGAFASTDAASGVAVQPDGKIVVAGYRSVVNYDIAVVRLNTDGSLDSTFDGDGIAIIPISTNN